MNYSFPDSVSAAGRLRRAQRTPSFVLDGIDLVQHLDELHYEKQPQESPSIPDCIVDAESRPMRQTSQPKSTLEPSFDFRSIAFEAASVPKRLSKYDGGRCMTTKTSKNNKQVLPSDFSPGPYDVVCGKGGFAASHVGNKRFDITISLFLARYSSSKSSRRVKSALLTEIVALVRSNSPQGGFVKFDKRQESWYEVGDYLARERVSQAFRDMLSDRYHSSKMTKRMKRLAAKVFVNTRESSCFGTNKTDQYETDETDSSHSLFDNQDYRSTGISDDHWPKHNGTQSEPNKRLNHPLFAVCV